MSQYPVQRIAQFMAQVAPFDALTPEDLDRACRLIEIAYYPPGKKIFDAGEKPPAYLHIIQSGSVKVTGYNEQNQEVLVDHLDEGETFAQLSLLEGENALFGIVAGEDLICYLLPAKEFRRLMGAYPAFQRHFLFSLARNLKTAMESDPTCQVSPDAAPAPTWLEPVMARGVVADVMSKNVLSCPPDTPADQAAAMMSRRRVGSMVIDDAGEPLGILTDSDLKTRVLADGRPPETPVAQVMSRPIRTISPQSPTYEAFLAMSHYGVRHLVVTDQGRTQGVLCDHDLQAMSGTSPVSVVRDIENVTSVDELVSLHQRIDKVMEMMLRQGGTARRMMEIVTEFNDRLTKKLLALTELEMLANGHGRAPMPFCWVALGSEGRREQTLRTDQDNALIFATPPENRLERIQAWFLEFSQKVVAALERCGFPLCTGQVMASNPKWCQSEREWHQTFLSWVKDPNPETLRLASIFFDFRSIYAESDFLAKLRELLNAAIASQPLFLRHMALNGLYNRPPLGFFRQFVLLKGGEQHNKLNLKLSGLTPMVDGARVLALELGTRRTNTLERLKQAASEGLLPQEMADDLSEAFSFISVLRISHHLEARARGGAADNFVDPDALNKLQRKMLKESFAVVSSFQDLLEHRYQTRSLG